MQDIIAILIAVAAAAFLARRAWQHFVHRRAGACGGCSSCPSGDPVKSQPLVTISPIVSHAKAQRRKEDGR